MGLDGSDYMKCEVNSMKKLLKKIAAIVMTAAFSVSVMAISTVSVGAAGVFDEAIEMDELETHSVSTDNKNGLKKDYEITIKKAGTIKVFSLEHFWNTRWQLLDNKSNPISDNHYVEDMTEFKDLEAGTYYLRVNLCNEYGYVNNFYYAFEPTEKPQLSFKITLKKGGKVQLGSIIENSDSKVTWLSTKKSVATVSKTGLVTAKKAGKTIIRATLESGEFAEITVVVSKK